MFLIVLPIFHSFIENKNANPRRFYFPAGTAPASFDVQNPVSGVVKEQTHALVGQGWVRLHLPLQVLV
jgi:hypothetical protein